MTPIVCYNNEKENGWPHPLTAERKTRQNSNALGARRWQKKQGEAEEDTAKCNSKKTWKRWVSAGMSTQDRH